MGGCFINWGRKDVKAALEEAGIKLDACIARVNSASQLSEDTRQILIAQAVIYASAISDFIEDRIEALGAQVGVVLEGVDQFCQLINRELDTR